MNILKYIIILLYLGESTEKDTFITKKLNFHQIKRRTFGCATSFSYL